VDGIVKGLKVPDWPTNGWQALQRLALQARADCKVASWVAGWSGMSGLLAGGDYSAARRPVHNCGKIPP
jgi:hypothetical protein